MRFKLRYRSKLFTRRMCLILMTLKALIRAYMRVEKSHEFSIVKVRDSSVRYGNWKNSQ